VYSFGRAALFLLVEV